MSIGKQSSHRSSSTHKHSCKARHRSQGFKTRSGLRAGQRPALLDGWNH
jgi:hypothetical protein